MEVKCSHFAKVREAERLKSPLDSIFSDFEKTEKERKALENKSDKKR
jgi:hypothetical protein